MKTVKLLFLMSMFFVTSITYAQTSYEYNSPSGIIYKKGDTLTFVKAFFGNDYMSLFKGKKASKNKILKRSVSGKKCIISKFQKKTKTSYAICKDLENNFFTVDVLMALTMNEIEITEKQKLSVKPTWYNILKISDPKKETSRNDKQDSIIEYKPFNFQGVTWKTTKLELKNLFPDLKPVGNFYVKEDLVSGLDTELLFAFEKKQLTNIMYSFITKHSNRNIYIEDYLKIKKILIEKYGKPERNIEKWRRDLYKDDFKDYGMAIAIGDLEYKTVWNLPDVGIVLSLTGDNYKINHVLGYLNKSKSQTSDKKNKEDLKKF